jgi:hypothetical protein
MGPLLALEGSDRNVLLRFSRQSSFIVNLPARSALELAKGTLVTCILFTA